MSYSILDHKKNLFLLISVVLFLREILNGNFLFYLFLFLSIGLELNVLFGRSLKFLIKELGRVCSRRL